MDTLRTQKLLMVHEGFRQYVYDDSTGQPAHGQGKLTVGFGRNLEAKGISQSEAENLLINDINYFNERLNSQFSYYEDLDDVRKAVLIDMAVNLGMAGLLEFTQFLSAVGLKQFYVATDQMINSRWHNQHVQRAEDLEQMMTTGKWPDFVG